MAKIEITKTELVWPGKYNEDGTIKEVPRVNLPFQVIETINESQATRKAKIGGQQIGLFDVWEGKEGDTFEEGWKNKLIWGDNLLVMGSLLEKFAGKIDLIYIDPPFATGADFSFPTAVGDNSLLVTKEQSIIEEKAYRDTWGGGIESYLQMIYDRLILIRELLSENGSIVVHLAPTVSHQVRCAMDEVFGSHNFRNEIIVNRPISKNLQRQFDTITALPQGHDVLLWYSSNLATRVQNLLIPYKAKHPEGYWHRFWSGADRPTMRYELLGETLSHGQWKWEEQRAKRAVENYKRYLAESRGRTLVEYWRDTGCQLEFIRKSETGTVENWFPPRNDKIGDTVWEDIKAYENQKDYPTQKHRELLERIISWLTKEGDLVLDSFCGSGTTLAVAEKLGRRWIGCDLSRWAIHVTRKRLLSIENCRPFDVLNLGKYERKYWMGVTFGDKKKDHQQIAIFQYIAFMLKLYRAEPITGMQHIHGKKGRALVHIGAVDAPVTIDEVNACIEECLAVDQKELHVLGWEWEMGMTPYIVQEAKRRGIKLLLVTIPREVMEQQAVDKGDIQFFEVAHLEVDIKKDKNCQITVSLTDFAFPYADMIPEDVRAKIKKWSDYIDYWAIDWNFQNDTFMNGWVAYRTRKERKLPLNSDPHKYEKPGKHTIMVKVVDIFGNDTSQTFEVNIVH